MRKRVLNKKPCYSKDILKNKKLTSYGFTEEKYFCDKCGYNDFYNVPNTNKYICRNCLKTFKNRDYLKVI